VLEKIFEIKNTAATPLAELVLSIYYALDKTAISAVITISYVRSVMVTAPASQLFRVAA
jgi:hypothetical protein